MAALPSSTWGRAGLLFLIAVVLPLTLLVLALRFVAPVREQALRTALAQADPLLPGHWSAGRIAWPQPDRLELDDFVWTDGADTLVAARRLAVEVEWSSLLRRDPHLRELTLLGARGDVPRLRAKLERDRAGNAEKEDKDGGRPPVRGLRCDSIRVEVEGLLVQPDTDPVRARLVGSFDAGLDRPPRLDLREVEADLPAWGLSVGPGSLRAQTSPPQGDGVLPIVLSDGRALQLAATVDASQRLQLSVDGAESFGARAAVSARLGSEESGRRRATDLGVKLELVRPERLSTVPGVPGFVTGLPPGSDVRLDGTGHVALPPEPELDLRVELTSSVELVGRATTRVLASADAWSLSDLTWSVEELEAKGRVTAADDRLDLDVRVTGAYGTGEARVDSIDIRTVGDARGPVDFDVAARAAGIWIAADGTRTGASPEVIETGPWFLGTKKGAVPDGPRGRIALDAEGGVAWTGLRIRGDGGNLALDGSAGADGADVRLDASWPTFPALLERFLPEEFARTAARSWNVGDRPALKARARANPDSTWTLDADFVLPGPRRLLDRPPEGVDLAGTETVRGRVTASGRGTDGRAALDLSSTRWLDRATLDAARRGDSIVADSLDVAGFGVQIRGSGEIADSLRGTIRIDLDSLDPLRERVAAIPPDLTAALAATIALTGTVQEPSAAVQAAARGGGVDWRADGLALDAELTRSGLHRLAVRSVDSLVVRGVPIRTVDVEVRPFESPDTPDSLALLGSVRVDSEPAGLALVAGITRRDGWNVAADTLAIRWKDDDLRTRAPFSLRAEPEGRWMVRGLDLQGTMGSLSADGGVGPDAADLRVELDLQVPPPPGPSTPWPERLTGTIRALRPDSLEAQLTADRFPPAESPTSTHVVAAAGPAGIAGDLEIRDGSRVPVRGTMRVPFAVDLAARTVRAIDGDAAVDVTLDDLRVPLRPVTEDGAVWFAPEGESRVGLASGRLKLAGSTAAPTGSFRGVVRFPDGSRLGDHVIDVDAGLTNPGLNATLRWSRDGVTAIDAQADVPGFKLAASAAPDFGPSLDVRVRQNDFPLRDLGPFLSPGTHLEGRIGCDVHVSGSPEDADLSGWLQADDVVASNAKGDRARGQGRVELGGTLSAPRASGRLVLVRGNFKLPEPERELHASTGDALLWEEPPPALARADSVVAAPIEALDLGIDISIPGSLALRGRGLDLNMTGDLSLVLVNGVPRVEGELQATSGSLSFLGTRFDVDGGRAVFYGGEEIDPDLDLTMSHRKGDATAFVRITGRSSAPRLDLSSEPPMEEADILAHVIFGRESSDLDGAETGFLEKQTATALRMFAMPEVERELGQRLGLDVVRLDAAGPAADQVSLTVGKYLSPRALLQVDQSLERTGDSALRLEYWLTRHLKLETITSRQSHSGVELDWSADY